MAHQKDEIVEELFKGEIKKYTSSTITDINVMRKTLKEVKENGYATSFGELSESVVTAAAPIWDYTGNVVAAVTVAGPSYRINSQNISRFIEAVVKTGREISCKMGYIRRKK